MRIEEVLVLVKKGSVSVPYKSVWLETYLRLSLYIYGVKPNYSIPQGGVYRTASNRSDTNAERYTKIYDNEIFSRYPHDSAAQLNFRKSIAAVEDMKSVYDKFLEQSESIIFQGNNFTVNTQDPALRAWIDNVRIDGFEFYEWIRKVVYSKMFVDPNAFIAVVEAHTKKLLKSQSATPMPVLISSEEIQAVTSEMLVAKNFGIDRTRQVLHNGYDDSTFIEYEHLIGELPALQLGGKYVSTNVWQSFVHSFIGIANSFIQEKSDVAVTKKTLAPRLQVVETLCKAEGCSHGYVETEEGRKACKSCNGTGSISMNLGDVVAIPEPKLLDGEKIQAERYIYTTPDATYIDIISKDVDKEFTRAEKSLFVYRKENGGVESGESFDKQFEEKKIFFQNISERVYYIMDEMLKYVSMFLNYNDGNPKPATYTIDKPVGFDLMGAGDLIIQYANEKKNGLPRTILNETEQNYVKKSFGENAVMLKKIQFLQLYDPFYGQTEVSSRVGVDVRDIYTHNYLEQMLELYIAEVKNEAFLKTPATTIYEELQKRIQVKVKDLPDALNL